MFTLSRYLTDGEKNGKTQLQSTKMWGFQIMKTNFVVGIFFKGSTYLYLYILLLHKLPFIPHHICTQVGIMKLCKADIQTAYRCKSQWREDLSVFRSKHM